MITGEQKNFDYTLIPLVLANLAPLYGVLFQDWSVFQVMFLFWAETAIVGFYSGLKFIKTNWILAIVGIPFFIFHFGMFMFGHLTFIYALFYTGTNYSGLLPPLSLLRESATGLELPILLLLISHGISFYVNFLKKGEYLKARNNVRTITVWSRSVDAPDVDFWRLDRFRTGRSGWGTVAVNSG